MRLAMNSRHTAYAAAACERVTFCALKGIVAGDLQKQKQL